MKRWSFQNTTIKIMLICHVQFVYLRLWIVQLTADWFLKMPYTFTIEDIIFIYGVYNWNAITTLDKNYVARNEIGL